MITISVLQYILIVPSKTLFPLVTRNYFSVQSNVVTGTKKDIYTVVLGQFVIPKYFISETNTNQSKVVTVNMYLSWMVQVILTEQCWLISKLVQFKYMCSKQIWAQLERILLGCVSPLKRNSHFFHSKRIITPSCEKIHWRNLERKKKSK